MPSRVTGPSCVLFQLLSDTTVSSLPSVYVICNWHSKPSFLPQVPQLFSHASALRYHPSASMAPTLFGPCCSSDVMSNTWYCNLLLYDVQPGVNTSSPTFLPLIYIS